MSNETLINITIEQPLGDDDSRPSSALVDSSPPHDSGLSNKRGLTSCPIDKTGTLEIDSLGVFVIEARGGGEREREERDSFWINPTEGSEVVVSSGGGEESTKAEDRRESSSPSG